MSEHHALAPKVPTRKAHRKTTEPWQHLDDGDILCHPALVLSYLVGFETATTSQVRTTLTFSGKSAKSTLWPPSSRQCTVTSHSVSRWDHDVATNSWQKWMLREPCTDRSAVSGPADRICPHSRKSGFGQNQSHLQGRWPYDSHRGGSGNKL